MIQIPLINSRDESMLKSMGIAPHMPPDPHTECMVRWIEERSKRSIAEETCIKNAQAYEKIQEATERVAERWQVRAYWGWIAAGMMFGLSVVLAVRLWVK